MTDEKNIREIDKRFCEAYSEASIGILAIDKMHDEFAALLRLARQRNVSQVSDSKKAVRKVLIRKNEWRLLKTHRLPIGKRVIGKLSNDRGEEMELEVWRPNKHGWICVLDGKSQSLPQGFEIKQWRYTA